MKKLILACCSLMIIAIGCKSGAGSDPKTTLTAFFNALSKKDLKEARKYATKESESMISMMEMGLKMAENMKTNETDEEFKKFQPSNMEMGEAKIDGDKAIVPVKSKVDNESTNFILKKEDGAWKVAFDKASMSEMAGDKMKNEKMDDATIDSLQNEFKNVDPDSLKKAMEEGMKVMDTLKKQ